MADDNTTSDFVREFAADIRLGMEQRPRQIPSKYLYDALGSHLFESICELPWYRITRAENELLTTFAKDMVAPLADPTTLIELGCGSGEKIAILAEAMSDRPSGVHVKLVDISQTAIDLSERSLARFAHVKVESHRTTYMDGLAEAAAERGPKGAALVLFLGSNIGNFARPAAKEMLAKIRKTLRPGDGLLLGADLVKPGPELVMAYDDPLGVTAAFNKNLLVRMNRELGAHFDLGVFNHRAVWNKEHARIEMRLVSRIHQQVRIEAADYEVVLAPRDYLWTESSYKYTPEQIMAMGSECGLTCHQQWIEPNARFSATLFMVA